MVGQNAGIGKSLGGLLGGGGTAGGGLGMLGAANRSAVGMTGGLTGMNMLGTGVGLAGMYASNSLSAGAITNTSLTQGQANGAKVGGALGSTASGALLGASIGSIIPVIGTGIGAAVGAGIGLGVGLYSNSKAQDKRESAIEDLDTQRRANAKAASGASFTSGDPVVDAINRQTDILAGKLDETAESQERSVLIYDMLNRTKATITE
jgi:phage tail tape-measure protein